MSHPALDQIEVLILTGGFGTRLRSVVNSLPKPMAPVNGRPFVEYILQMLIRQGFKNYCFLAGYLSDEVIRHFQDGQRFGVQIRYSVEDAPLGTGGSVKKGIESSDFSHFLILNGDSFFGIDYTKLLNAEGVSMALSFVHDISRYGGVVLKNGFVEKFQEKSPEKDPGYINAGAYFMTKDMLKEMPETAQFSLEKDFFSKVAGQHQLRGFVFQGPFLDIGIPEDYQRAGQFLSQHL